MQPRAGQVNKTTPARRRSAISLRHASGQSRVALTVPRTGFALTSNTATNPSRCRIRRLCIGRDVAADHSPGYGSESRSEKVRAAQKQPCLVFAPPYGPPPHPLGVPATSPRGPTSQPRNSSIDMNWTRLIRTLVAGVAVIVTAAQLEAQTRYVLVSNLTGKVLTVGQSWYSQPETVYQADYTAGRNQQWIVSRPNFDGTVQIRNVATGRVLEYAATADQPTAKARRAVSDRVEQKWRIESLGEDAAAIVNEYSGLELTVYPWLNGDVAPIILSQTWGSEMYSKWLLVPASSTPTPATLDLSTLNETELWAKGTRNVIRVAFKLWTQPNGKGDVVWREGLYLPSSDRWAAVGNIPIYKADISQVWAVEAHGLGVDNVWHPLIGTKWVIFAQPPGGDQPEMRGK